MLKPYDNFLKNKSKTNMSSGFIPDENDFNKNLFDFQSFILKTAITKGKYAVFADCGLGKTIIQLEWARIIAKKENKRVLIIAPLAVTGQTTKEAEKFNIDISNIDITNYEQLDHYDAEKYSGVVLDESSILKQFTGKTRTYLINKFKDIKYKLCCTATPSPNDIDELGNHAEFLNVMNFNEMRAMFFINDMQTTQKWRLKKHAEDAFWKWVSSWAIMINTPSDIGFDSRNYILPKLNIIKLEVKTPKKNDGRLFNDNSVNATEYNQELRDTMGQRIKIVSDIVNNSGESFIIWVKQNIEADLAKSLIPDSVEVRGNEKSDIKKEKLLGFSENKYRVLITKSSIAQYGMNYQNCHNMIFASLDFSFESTYQSIRREWRFGQKKEVNVYMVITDTMYNVIDIFNKKQKQFKKMQDMMIKYFKKGVGVKMEESTVLEQHNGENYQIYRGDCIKIIKNIENDKMGMIIFSPPFAELYTYSSYIEDMGNSINSEQFYEHFKYLIPELKRIIMPGRNICVHCMDIPTKKSVEGVIGLKDFSGELIKMFADYGFIYHSRITIWKDPVVQMQRTKALGLLHKQIKKDSIMSRAGLPDYILVFRDNRENSNPVRHNDSDLPVNLWQKYASPVWMDINSSFTLQKNEAKDEKDEKHICPLQLDVIERCIHLWSNNGDKIFTPFMGIGSEVYQSIKMNRCGVGIELKKSYYDVALSNCKQAELEKKQLTLF